MFKHVAIDAVVVADAVAGGAAGSTANVAVDGIVVVVAFVVVVFSLKDVVNYVVPAHVFVFNLDGNDEEACAGTHLVLRDFGGRLVFEDES